MYRKLSSQFFRPTSEIHSGLGALDTSKVAMTF